MTVNDLFELVDLIDDEDQTVLCDLKWQINKHSVVSNFCPSRNQLAPIHKGFSIDYDFIIKHIKIKAYHNEDDTYDYILKVDVEPPTGGYNE